MKKEEIIRKLWSVDFIRKQVEMIKSFKETKIDFSKELQQLYGAIRVAKELLNMGFYGIYMEDVVDWLIEE